MAKVFAGVLKVDHDRYGVYNVGTGIGRSIEDIVNLVKEYFPDMATEHGSYKGVLYDSIADVTKIREAVGFNPDKSDRKFRETIEKMIRNSKMGARK